MIALCMDQSIFTVKILGKCEACFKIQSMSIEVWGMLATIQFLDIAFDITILAEITLSNATQ